ncbi:MAG: hypothetical protein JNK82_24110 [Myxococcaceae bacterium]|nr:hypothetical protein [Myxococcaceae bacterium]
MESITRYQARKDELEALKAELENQARKGDPGPVAQRVLEAAGDLLRRKQQVPCDGALIDGALRQLSAEGLKSYADGLNVDELKSRVQRCADEAVEAALPDSDEDSNTWSAWAMQGLLARDRAESAVCALQHLAKLGRPDATPIHTRLTAALTKLDVQTKSLAVALTALNASRRTERDLLDGEFRTAAWWFSHRAETSDDGLVRALGSDDAKLAGPEAAAAEEVLKPRKRAVSFDELFRYDLGLATDAEQAFIAQQKKVNPELARALAAMEEGERAILELTGAAPQNADNVRELRRAAGQGATATSPSAGSGQVVEERREFRVLLFRRAAKVHLVVQPSRDGALAAAAVFLPDAPEVARPSHATEAGLDFELGPEKQLERVTARVVVTLKGGRSATVAVKL